MPHTSRKNRKLPPRTNNKPAQVTLENGWTLVTRSKSHFRPDMEREPITSSADTKRGLWFVYNEGATIEGLTLERLIADFERQDKLYLESECCQVVRRHIKNAFGRDDDCPYGRGGKITNAVCLALGSMCQEYAQIGRFWQLAMFRDIVQQLKHVNGEFDVFAQEPAFRQLDKEFLKSLGITILEDPAATQVITRTSFVYAAYMYAPTLLCDILPGKDPALVVNPDFSEHIQLNLELRQHGDRDEETLRNARRFEDGWHKETIPEHAALVAGTAFSGLCIYWKESDPC